MNRCWEGFGDRSRKSFGIRRVKLRAVPNQALIAWLCSSQASLCCRVRQVSRTVSVGLQLEFCNGRGCMPVEICARCSGACQAKH